MSAKQHIHHAILCLDRLKAWVEHGNLSTDEAGSIAAEVNELYERHVSVPVRCGHEN